MSEKLHNGVEPRAEPEGAILVAVGPAPQSADLIRVACRMATRLHAPWIALTVETPAFDRLPASEHDRVRGHLGLAGRLGAETLVVRGENVPAEVLAVARERKVSLIVVGKPTHPRWRERLRGSLVDEIVHGSQGIDVIVTTGSEWSPAKPAGKRPRPAVPFTEYLYAIAIVGLSTAACWLTRGTLSLADQAMIFLLGVLGVASKLSRGPALLAAVASVAALDFFFVPPFFTFAVSELRYVITFAVMLVVGLTVSSLTVRIRTQAEAARQRERRMAALWAISRELGAATGADNVGRIGARHLAETIEAPVELLLAGADGELREVGGVQGPQSVLQAARWAFEHGKPAGSGTDTLPSSTALVLPLMGTQAVLGVVTVDLTDRSSPTPSQRQLLDTLVAQTALALERARLAQEARAAETRAEREELRNALLSSVSHDLRTPLASITGAATALIDGDPPRAAREDLLETIHEEADRLNRLVGNLLDMTRLESGGFRLRKEWVPIEEVVGCALNRLERALSGRRVELDLPADLPLVALDPVLVEQVFINLLENAAKYTRPETPIEIGARAARETVVIEVADRGPGLAAGAEERVFEKFFRACSAPAGSGLGLTICRGILQAHGGQITAENRPGGGALFRITLPVGGSPPALAPESAIDAQETG
ncbi:MAG: sensor histidine kinase KdpD [Deltaproteobacteria bacterium]|nr:sensor histidine kinase KdpD [Deltaproteobacteria bacterium]